MEQIIAASIQFNIRLGDIDANLAHVREAIGRVASQGANLAVLPEMWSTGFSYKNLPLLADRTGRVLSELQELSARHGMVIIGSQPEPADDGKVYNTAHVIDHGKIAASYSKLHLFSLLGEDKAFKAGDSRCLADTSIGKLGVIICYDLRFPELSRALALDGARLLCVPAQWPKPRQEHWRTLLRARAIENQLYVVSANSCGITGKLDFFGMSMIIGPKGDVMADAGEREVEIVAPVNWNEMDEWRSQIPCFKDRRPDLY